MIDLPMIASVFEHGFLEHYVWMIATQITLILGLLVGTRGTHRFKEFMLELRGIAFDPQYDKDESIRGHLLKQQINYACLEYDAWFFAQSDEKQNEITNKLKGEPKTLMDEVVKKQIGYSLVGIWESFLPVFVWLLSIWGLHPVLNLFLSATWGILGAFVGFYIHYVFGIEKPTPKEEITKLIAEN